MIPEAAAKFDIPVRCPCGLTWYGASHALGAPDDWRTKNGGSIIRLFVRRGGRAYCRWCGAAVGVTESGEAYSTEECTWRQIDELRARLLGQRLTIHRLRRRLVLAETKMTAEERMAVAAQVIAEGLTAVQSIRGEEVAKWGCQG